MAPEQAQGSSEQVDPRTDIFGLGAVLYEILTGVPPYHGKTYPEVVEAARTRTLVPPDERTSTRIVSPELRRVCLKAMALDKNDRHQCVAEFAGDILEILRGGGWFEIRRFAPGEVIVREGEPSDSAYVLKSGQCRVVKTEGVHQQQLRVIGPGDVFGEVGLITGELRSATIIAQTVVEVQVISSRSIKESLAHQGLLGRFLHALAQRFLDVDRKLFAARRDHRNTSD
jgi:serine/threonine-protein kinase